MKMPKLPRERMFDAIQKGNVKELQVALRAGANINDRNQGGYPALHQASRRSAEVFAVVLEAKPDLNSVDHNGNTALHWAATCGYIENAHALLNAGADYSVHNEFGETARDDAVANGCPSIIRAIEARQAEDLRQQFERNTASAPARYTADDQEPWTPSAADSDSFERQLAGVREGEAVVRDQTPLRARSLRL